MKALNYHEPTPLGGRLTPQLARRLAAMDGASTAAIESAIAAMPFSARASLTALGVVRAQPPSEPGRMARLRLTDTGRGVIADCVRWEGRSPQTRMTTAAAAAAQAEACVHGH